MYQPAHFKIEDREALLGVIRAHPLALLITSGPGGLMANPIPFLLRKNESGEDILAAHLARPNPQWQELEALKLEAGAEPLIVFQGVNHYISPNFYATKAETHKVVPTWNYVIVQVRGPAKVSHGAEALHPHITALTDTHEAMRAAPWQVSDAPESFIEGQMRGIVAIEITIRAIIGKFKLSQNRKAEDQAGVIKGLEAEGDAAALGMAAMMAARHEAAS